MGDGGGCILLFSRQPPLVAGLLRRGPLPLLDRTPTVLTPTSSTATATATGVPAPELGNLLSHPPAVHSNGQGEPLWPPLGVIDMELCPSSSSSPSQLQQQQQQQQQPQPQPQKKQLCAAAASATTSIETVNCLLEDGKKEEQGKKEHADCTRQLSEQPQPQLSSPIHGPHEGNIKLQSNTTRAEEKASGNEIMLQGDGQDGCTITSHNKVDTVRAVSEDGMSLRRNDTSSSHRVAVKFSDAASSHSHASSADNCREKCEHILDEGCNGTSANLHFSHKRNGSGSGSDSPAGKCTASSDRRSSYGGSAQYNSNSRLREESEGERSHSQRGGAESHVSSRRRSNQYAGEKRSYPQRDIEHYRLEELSNNRDGDLQREERLHRKESGYHQREERSSSRVRSCHRETDHQYDEQKESEGSHPREFNYSHEEKSQQREMDHPHEERLQQRGIDRQHEDRSQEKELKMESGYQKEKSYQRESSRQKERSFHREGDNQRDRLHRESDSQRERYQRDGDGRRERSQQRESDSKRESSYSHGDRSHRKEADYRAEDSSHLKGYKERSQQREKSRQRENDHEHDDRLRQRERSHRKEGLHQHEEQLYPGARPRQRESDHQHEERSHRRENDCQPDERTQKREGNYRHEGKLHQRERSTRQESDHLSMERPQWTDSDLPSEERLHRRDSDSHPEERIRRRESDYLYRGRSHQHGERSQRRESDNQPDEKSNQRDSGSQYRERSNQRDSDHRHERDFHSTDNDNQHEQMPHQKVGTYRREEKLHQRESGHRYEERSHHRESSSQHEEKAQQRERSHPRESNYGHEERLHQREGDHPREERSTQRESNHQNEERPNRREGDRQYEGKATPREGDHQYEDRSTWREGNHQYEERSTQKEGGHQYEERPTLKEGDHQHEERSRRRETDYQHIERSQKRENDHFYEDRSHWRESHHEYPSRSRWRENDRHYEERSHGKEGEQYEDRLRRRDYLEDRLGWKDSDNCREERLHQESNLPHEERQHGRESDHCSSREQVDHHSHPRDKQQCKDKEDADDSRTNDLHAPAVVESLTCDGGYADDSRYEMMEVEMEISPEPSVEHHAPHSSFEVTWNDANYADNSFMCRGWVYINSKGCTRGPMNLSELKQLMVNGELQPDHLVKLSNSNSWVTLENARSPVPEDPLTFIPTAFPGQLQAQLSWNDPYHQQFLPACGKSIECIEQVNCVKLDAYERDVVNVCSYGSGIEQSFVEPEELPDLRIDERVDELMKGFALTPGHEKEVISEALNRAARSVLEDDEMDSGNEAESPRSHTGLAAHWKENQLLEGEQALEGLGSNVVEVAAPKENLLETDALCVNSFQSTRKWTARGGDWKLTHQPDVATGGKVQVNAASSDRSLKTKIVLNGGIPLCEGRLSDLQDPRRELQDSSNTQGFKRRRLEIPPWGVHWFHSQVLKIEEQWMQNGQPPANATPNRPLAMQISQVSTPGAHMLTPKGTAAASGGFRDALKMNRSGKEVGAGSTLSGIVGHMGLAPLACESTPAGFQNGFLNISSQECLHETVDGPQAKLTREYESFHISENPSSSAYVEFSQPFGGKLNVEGFAEQLQREKDLNLHKGDWYYREGTGQEIGPNPYSELQLMLKHGLLGNGITIYRRSDDIWIPLSLRSVSLSSAEREGQNCPSIALQESRSSQHLSEEETNSEEKDELLNFHQTYPQFMGYMCGMLHDHVMKSFRIGPFAATLTEGLDKWHGDKQRESLGGVVQALVGTMNVSSQVTATSSRNVADGSFDVDDKGFKISSRDIEAQPSLSAEATGNADKKRCLDSGDSALFKQQAIQSMDSSDTKCNVLKEETCVSEMQIESSDEHSKSSIEFEAWGALDSRVLATIFFNLKGDSRSLIRASAVCKSWRLAFEKFRQEAKDMDFSSLGNILTDIMLESSHLRNKRGKNPSTQTVDISSFEQPKDSSQEFPEKKRIGPSSMPKESHRNFKSLKQINMKSAAMSNENCADEISEPMELDSLDDASQTVNSHNFLKCLKSEKADSGSDNYSHKGVRRDHAGTELREKAQVPPTSEQKQKRDGPMQAFKMNHHISSSEKISSPKVKKESSWRAKVSERDKSIERMLAEVLRKVKAADTQKIFSHQVPDAKGTISRPLDFAAIENKLKGGEYPRGKDGVLSFKDDLFLLCRSAFHGCRKGNPVFNAAEQVFKLAYRLVSEVEKTYDPKRLYNGTLIKASQGKSNKNSSISQISGKRREFSEEPLKYRGTKRRRDADSGSLDDDSEENSSEKDGRRVPSHLRKKKQQREWGMDSSGSDEEEDNSFYEEDESDDGHEIGSISESDGEDAHYENDNALESEAYYQEWFDRTWGARMTKAAMVPPVTRKYDVIDKYMVIADNVEVEKKMKVNLPEEYEKKLQAAKENRGAEYSHLEIPELKDYSPRKRLGDEVIEQEVYGIDPYTYNLLLDSMPPERDDFSESKRQQLIEEDLLRALNKGAMPFTSTGKTPMKFPLEQVVERLIDETRDFSTKTFYQALLKAMENRPKDKYVAYRKGLGVVCNKKDGFQKDDFVVEFFGEVYPAWRWYEKQDAIRSLQKNDKDPAPEFYNIFLERPKGDASGYDLVVVDAMHKANYASRICHSCRPNCEAKVTAVNGCYQIGVYTLRPVHFGEELTFDYNSVTESKEEHEASVCLCGNQVCRGSYLHLAGSGTFQEVMKRSHGLLDRHHLLLEACTSASITESDWDILKQAGLGSSLLEGLPDWAICYIAGLVRFINQERKDLPKEIMKIYAEDRRLETWGEIETFDAEVQADGVYNQRLQNLAITLDKVRYILKQFYSDLKAAPPPLRKLRPEEIVSLIWKGEHSVVMELLQAMEVHCSKDYFEEFQRKIHEHDPLESGNIEENLRKSLLWLRDELCKVPVSCSGQHDAAADILHMYAYTKVFFTSQDYNVVESPPLTINSLDLGPKYAHLLGSSSYEWRKSYSKDYILGQLLFWYTHNSADPGSTLAKAQCGCLVLPDISSCFAKSHIQDRRLMYSRRHRAELLEHLEKKPQKKWPRSEFWEFKNCGGILGSRVMDSRIGSGVIDGEMMDWLKNRASVAAFESPLDD